MNPDRLQALILKCLLTHHTVLNPSQFYAIMRPNTHTNTKTYTCIVNYLFITDFKDDRTRRA